MNGSALRSGAFYLVLAGAGMLCVLFAGALPLGLAAPIPSIDIICLLICYLFLKNGFAASFLAATGFGWAADVYSGGGHGVFMLGYASAFGASYAASLFLDMDQPKGQIIFVLAAAFARKTAFIPASAAFSADSLIPEMSLWNVIFGSLLTAFLAPAFFFALGRLRASLGLEGEAQA